ncbi:hypothetical protein [Mucilaginibacter xinganensis]|uniref:Uncharacterized protein n=1 Tax=Mucilaginibacter xinganensis TaxID=1234841 RepID=A0A223P3J9_9SPHI|nr:hypothetical protein [Mucilaginibacter xinganensis]ASU36656.1 hypothetical protein MuYL_4773 [Mucilaginibacter xinganensis]
MKKNGWILLLFCFACTQKPKGPVVTVSASDNNRSVKFKGLDYAILSEINRDTTRGIWENLLPVYRMPADTDLKNYQPVQHGLYTVIDSAVVFTPDTPLIKGKTYFMRYYRFKGENIWDYIKGKKRLGGVGHTDLVIKLQR